MSKKIKIYTKTGDKGETSLYGGKRVSKADIRVQAYGIVDELNAHVGLLISSLSDDEIKDELLSIQNDLFAIGSVLSGSDVSLEKLTNQTTMLEKSIDKMEKELPELKNFILPGGAQGAAQASICRTVTRRVERSLVSLSESNSNRIGAGRHIFSFINRLSDYFFVLSRFLNVKSNKTEAQWSGDKYEN